ncbi:uncharacterized protein LOC120003669 [Tripterygium wilfordii]|uniref:uncharacterized protein LOC120003669 n=1 Tax=Tripterygium wilfordii TaxID=458696 RepID=UPI0018F85024|nr:uncharacterized protein LOC120003669 [Tripterygium wilfordii]
MTLFSSEKWASSTWTKKPGGMRACATVLHDRSFWGNIAFCIKSVGPLVSVLREVDSEERPAIGYIYELMDTTKEKIQIGCGGNKKKCDPIWKRIDTCWTLQLHQPWMLSYEDRLKADIQLDLYDHARGNFGLKVAIDTRKLRFPTDWWERFGGKTSKLQRFAIRIHTEKRNRLEHQRLNALVYVMYNTRLRERSIRRKLNIDPVLVEEIESDDEWIAEKEDPILPLDTSWIDDEQLFNVDAIRSLSVVATAISGGNGDDRGKNKAPRVVLVREDYGDDVQTSAGQSELAPCTNMPLGDGSGNASNPTIDDDDELMDEENDDDLDENYHF